MEVSNVCKAKKIFTGILFALGTCIAMTMGWFIIGSLDNLEGITYCSPAALNQDKYARQHVCLEPGQTLVLEAEFDANLILEINNQEEPEWLDHYSVLYTGKEEDAHWYYGRLPENTDVRILPNGILVVFFETEKSFGPGQGWEFREIKSSN